MTSTAPDIFARLLGVARLLGISVQDYLSDELLPFIKEFDAKAESEFDQEGGKRCLIVGEVAADEAAGCLPRHTFQRALDLGVITHMAHVRCKSGAERGPDGQRHLSHQFVRSLRSRLNGDVIRAASQSCSIVQATAG